VDHLTYSGCRCRRTAQDTGEFCRVLSDATKLRRELRNLGLSRPAINAAWPDWWSDEAANSISARAELRFSLARKLGLDPQSLLEDERPRFVWRGEGKFKRLTTETEQQRVAISSFGASIARPLLAGTPEGPSISGLTAERLRGSITARRAFPRLVDLLAVCWAAGIPVIHLRVFPLSAKRMCAMAVRIGNRFAVLLAKDAVYPAPIAFYLAHEIGHIALDHLGGEITLVDMQDPLEQSNLADDEELAADRFAIELLTGRPDFSVDTDARRFTARQLAKSAIMNGPQLGIEPGTLVMCFGYKTGQWRKAHAAMKLIYEGSHLVWAEVNGVAGKQLKWEQIPLDTADFLRAVMGGIQEGERRSR